MTSELLWSLADKLRCVSVQLVAEWREEEPIIAVGALGGCSAVVHGLWSAELWD